MKRDFIRFDVRFGFGRRLLLGHTSIKTTEIYTKARLPDLVAPTSRPMVKLQAGDGK